jgi:LacI family transcriptional regulator
MGLDTQEAVGSAVERLGFRPFTPARALRGYSTHVLGLIVPSITNPSLSTIIRGAEERSREAGCALFLSNIDRHWERAVEASLALIDRGVEGIGYAFAASGSMPEVMAAAARSNTRLAFAVPKGDGLEGAYAVMLDNEAGMGRLGEHLWQLGHRHIAFVSNLAATANGRWRLAGLRAVYEARGGIVDAYVDPIDFDRRRDWGEVESGRRSATALLNVPNRPTAICAVNDMVAVGVMRGAVELGLHVPRDVSVAGFDDLSVSRVAAPPLTTLAVPGYEIGVHLAELLLDRAPVQPTTITPTLVARGSTGPAPMAT